MMASPNTPPPAAPLPVRYTTVERLRSGGKDDAANIRRGQLVVFPPGYANRAERRRARYGQSRDPRGIAVERQ